MTTRFPSAEWAAAFQQAINANEEYQAAARQWEGDILLLVSPDAQAPRGEGIYLELAHGSCRSARFVADPSGLSSEFVYEGSRENWARLVRRELDPVKAILDGTFKVRGNLAKLMRFTRAAKALVETASLVPTDG